MAFDFGNANEAQRSAISTTDGPLLIIAGPGTGKTYTLVKRIVYLIIEKDVLPEEIMIATFTEKAAKELITRITNELYAIGVSVNLNEMYIGTFHSICLRILKDHLEYTRIKKNYRMLDNFDQQYMVFQKINRFRNLPYFDVIFDKKQGAWRQAGEIVKYVNNLAEELVDIDEMQGDADEHIVAVANIMKQYNTLMEDENLIDFSSIQTEAYKLLIEEPSILEEIQQKIKYVMVDEYQDTNYIQELLVFLIAGKNKNICVVGDDDQGLYRFRGATIRNILEFPGHFAEGECKQVKLVTNYRSERQIIDFYNKWMSTTDGRAYDFMWKNFRFEKKIVPPEGKKAAKVGVIKCSGKDLLDDWYEQVYSFITQLKSSGVLTDYNQIHRAAMRHEEQTIVPETIREWFDTNYMTLSKSEHSYLGQPQIEAAYKQVLRYVERNQSDWSRIQDAEVEVSLVKPDYILLGKVDLIRGEGDTVEIVDFKSEKKPDVLIETAEMNRYRRQLEVYAHLIEEKTGKKVSKMHLYYTGEDNGVPTITFNKSTEMIDKTIKEFDEVVEKIQHKDFSGRAKDKNLCANCDMRHYCRRKGDC